MLFRSRSEISSLEIETLLNGEYDHRNALVTIRSEAGGVDASDWAEMVMRMFLRYCEKKGYQVQILDTSYGEEAGIKSVTFKVEGPYAYGSLSVEQGTHRLVLQLRALVLAGDDDPCRYVCDSNGRISRIHPLPTRT